MAKIHLVTLHSVDSGAPERTFLVRAHTRAGAERHVAKKIGRFIEAKKASQDELVEGLRAGKPIEDATGMGLDSDVREPSGHQPPPDTTEATQE